MVNVCDLKAKYEELKRQSDELKEKIKKDGYTFRNISALLILNGEADSLQRKVEAEHKRLGLQ